MRAYSPYGLVPCMSYTEMLYGKLDLRNLPQSSYRMKNPIVLANFTLSLVPTKEITMHLLSGKCLYCSNHVVNKYLHKMQTAINEIAMWNLPGRRTMVVTWLDGVSMVFVDDQYKFSVPQAIGAMCTNVGI